MNKNFFLFMFCASLTVSAMPLMISIDGKPNAEIVLPQQLQVEQPALLAAQELQLWIREISGAELQIVTNETKTQPIVLKFALKPTEFPQDTQAIGKTDGYAVRPTINGFMLFANVPGGLLRGVHRLLYRNTDIIWARPNRDFGTVFTKNPNLSFTQFDYVDIPAFIQRGWQIETGRNEGAKEAFAACDDWQMRNCSNWSTSSIETKKRFGFILEYGGGHNLIGLYIQPQKYWNTHPEFYSQLGGKLTDPRKYSARTQLCFTNPLLLQTFKEELEARIKANPDYVTYRVMIEDNFDMCECPNCLKDITLPDGRILKGNAPKRSDEWLAHRNTQFFLWYNELAKYMKEHHPGKRLLSFAYFFTEPAPLIPIEDNIDISFCPIFKDSRADVLDERNKTTFDRLSKWLSRTPNVTWREYYGLNVPYPRPIDTVAFRDYRYLRSQGVKRTYSEMVCDFGNFHRWPGDDVWDLGAPFLWNLTNAVWNPEQDCHTLRHEFCERCFGKAADDMEAFYNLLEEHWYATRKKSVWNDRPNALWNLLRRDQPRFMKMAALLDSAIAKADKPNGKIMLERLKKSWQNHNISCDVVLHAGKVAEPPPFDATLENGPWATAPVVPPFPNAPKTTVKLLHDGIHLYAAMRAEGKDVKKKFRADIKYVQQEAFNIFFEIANPTTGQPDSVHFLVDPVGGTYHSLSENRPIKLPWKHQEILEDNSWTIMLTIPLAPMTKPLKVAIFRRYTKSKPWPLLLYGFPNTEMHEYTTFCPLILD